MASNGNRCCHHKHGAFYQCWRPPRERPLKGEQTSRDQIEPVALIGPTKLWFAPSSISALGFSARAASPAAGSRPPRADPIRPTTPFSVPLPLAIHAPHTSQARIHRNSRRFPSLARGTTAAGTATARLMPPQSLTEIRLPRPSTPPAATGAHLRCRPRSLPLLSSPRGPGPGV